VLGARLGRVIPDREMNTAAFFFLSSAGYPKWRNPYRSCPHTPFFSDYSQMVGSLGTGSVWEKWMQVSRRVLPVQV